MANSSPTYTPDEFPFQDSQPCIVTVTMVTVCIPMLCNLIVRPRPIQGVPQMPEIR